GVYQLEDYPHVVKLLRRGMITQVGETIDGQGLYGVVVLG
ncbi:MAG TPA: phage repressor protein, partial [Pantoea sp.]|nr:phage repressor protein [Pantoea sp.]